MTTVEYITQRFRTFGVMLTDADILGICLSNNLSQATVITADNLTSVDRAIVAYVPTILLMPNSIGEGGVSISRTQRDDIMQWYNLMCTKYSIKNELEKRSKITFR